MKTTVIDMRSPSKVSIASFTTKVQANRSEVLIILGHGSKDTVCGLSGGEMPEIPNVKILWIYACHCGNQLIHSLASKYEAVIGYATAVLAPATVESTVAYKIGKIIDTIADETQPEQVIEIVQKELLFYAVALMNTARKNGREESLLFFQAAMINHTRLSMRVGRPSKAVRVEMPS